MLGLGGEHGCSVGGVGSHAGYGFVHGFQLGEIHIDRGVVGFGRAESCSLAHPALPCSLFIQVQESWAYPGPSFFRAPILSDSGGDWSSLVLPGGFGVLFGGPVAVAAAAGLGPYRHCPESWVAATLARGRFGALPTRPVWGRWRGLDAWGHCSLLPAGDGCGGALHDGTLPSWQFLPTAGGPLWGLSTMWGALLEDPFSFRVWGVERSPVVVVGVVCLGTGWIEGFGVARLLPIWSFPYGCPGSHFEPGRFWWGGLVNSRVLWFVFLLSLLGVFLFGLGIFLVSGFPSPLLFLFVWFADFGSYVLGGSFCRGCGRFEHWVPGRGP